MNRNFGLDLLRSISIWLVLLQHLGINILKLSPLKIGGIGVEIFFVLSGFLIGRILFKELDKGLGARRTLYNFWIRRWFRILPLYYGVLLLKLIAIDHSIGWNILYYIFFLQNNFFGIDFYHVTWSLVIEEWFYLFVPVFLLLVKQLSKSKTRILVSCFVFIGFVNIIRFFYVYNWDIPYVGVNSNFPFRFDSLFLGVILAYLQLYLNQYFKKLQEIKIFVTGLFFFLIYLMFFYFLNYYENKIDDSLLIRTAGFFILPFTIALMVPYVTGLNFYTEKSRINRLIYNFITNTSLLTYSIYLLHPLVFTFIAQFCQFILIKILLSITLTYILSFIVYQIYEKPILQLREKLTN